MHQHILASQDFQTITQIWFTIHSFSTMHTWGIVCSIYSLLTGLNHNGPMGVLETCWEIYRAEIGHILYTFKNFTAFWSCIKHAKYQSNCTKHLGNGARYLQGFISLPPSFSPWKCSLCQEKSSPKVYKEYTTSLPNTEIRLFYMHKCHFLHLLL